MSDQLFIKATKNWLSSFIIALNICPFARREQEKNSIRFQIIAEGNLEQVLTVLIQECDHLDTCSDTETTLLIIPYGFDDFDDYLDMLAIAEQLLIEQKYEGIYQLASFHPDYRFQTELEAEMESEDAANFTNRSPYPMLHIIRETSIDNVLACYPDPENIPYRNIETTRKLGLKRLSALLNACYVS